MSDLSIKEVAAQLGVAPSTIYNIESGRVIDAKTQLRLINWLFAETEQKTEEKK